MSIEDDFTFISDKSRIQFILNSLISNALKYSIYEKESPVVEIKASKKEKETIIYVTDNGIGISEKVLPHIFKMFYRGSLKSTGSGLGLYIVKEAVDKLNGTISVKSEPGIFTSFTITLPEEIPVT
jgi:signal transduction histidine kinase